MYVLLIDDDPQFQKIFGKIIEPVVKEGSLEVRGFQGAEEALGFIEEHHDEIAVIFTDYKMPGMDGVELVGRLEHRDRDYQIILLSGRIDQALTRSLPRLNLFDVIEKDATRELVPEALRGALLFYRERSEKQERLQALLARFTPEAESTVENFFGIVGAGASYTKLVQSIQRVADSTATCFIRGESGTGKELIAGALHQASRRSEAPFNVVNCAAIPADLFESELFGHKKGSFTGALEDKQGIIEQTNGGTLFLDEITEMPPALQPKLLRFLQEGTIRPVGSAENKAVAVRVVASSNRDMARAIEDGVFREDLYFRVNVVPIEAPPLRERLEDLEVLCRYFLAAFARLEGSQEKEIHPEVLEIFGQYYWPGNIRELRNIIHRMTLFAEGNEIMPFHIPDEILNYTPVAPEPAPAAVATASPVLPGAEPGDADGLKLKSLERSSIEKALALNGGNKNKAAASLGISRATIYRKIKEYNL